MVVQHSRSGWNFARRLDELLDLDPTALHALRPLLPTFEYLLDDLSGARSEDLKAWVMTALGRLTLLCLRESREQADLIPELSAWQDLLREASAAPNGVRALCAVVLCSEHERDETRGDPAALQVAASKVEEAFMTGAQIPTQEARAEGRAESKAELVLKQLAL